MDHTRIFTEMGRRGPPPKSSVVRNLEGDRSHRKSKGVAISAKGKPVCPAHLGDYEREIWFRIVRSSPPGLLAEMDSVILSAYCVAAGLHREAVLKIASEGATQITMQGGMTQSPWVLVMAKQVQAISSLGSKLGLDPGARMNLGNQSEKAASKFGDLLEAQPDPTE